MVGKEKANSVTIKQKCEKTVFDDEGFASNFKSSHR